MDRGENLRSIAKDTCWDLIVIGGGAIGLGCAMEAAGRGYNTLLLEANDFASGTSSRSSKMIHGGLRYLRQFDIAMVRQSMIERGHLFKTASNWVKEQRIIIPLHSRYDIAMYKLGLFVYDKLAGSYNLTPSEVLSAKEVVARLPGLNSKGVKGAVVYSDGIFDDARLAVNIARAASKLGAKVINYIPVVSLMKKDDKLVGVVAKDKESGIDYEIRAHKVINATGNYADSIMNLDEPQKINKQVISQGSHIVIASDKFPPSAHSKPDGMLIPQTEDGRLMFCLPWHERVLIGTTDIVVQHPSQQPQARSEEIDFILRNSRSYFSQSIGKEDILSVFAGQRSLVSRNASSKELSRSHKVIQGASGLVSVLGGKWTTYRVAAKDAVNEALGVTKGDLKEFHSLDSLLSSDLSNKQGELIHPNLPYRTSDVINAVKNEMALKVEDVLARRTRALFLDSKAAISCADKVAAIMAIELNQDSQCQQAAIKDFNQVAQQYTIQ